MRRTPIDAVMACGGRRVKLFIDLSSTTRFYRPPELPVGVRYMKLPVQGHSGACACEHRRIPPPLASPFRFPSHPPALSRLLSTCTRTVPSDARVDEAIKLIKEVQAEAPTVTAHAPLHEPSLAFFAAALPLACAQGIAESRAVVPLCSCPPISWNGFPGQSHCPQAHGSPIAVVHCTHGINRTGYLVAIALVRLHHMSVQQALAAFAKVRPPGVWREEYVRTLVAKYGGSMPKLAPPPAWSSQLPKREDTFETSGDLQGSRPDDQQPGPDATFFESSASPAQRASSPSSADGMLSETPPATPFVPLALAHSTSAMPIKIESGSVLAAEGADRLCVRHEGPLQAGGEARMLPAMNQGEQPQSREKPQSVGLVPPPPPPQPPPPPHI